MSENSPNLPLSTEEVDGMPDVARMQSLWMALGAPSEEFEAWYFDPKMTRADAWALLLGAVRGSDLSLNTNPPAGEILGEIAARRSMVQMLFAAAFEG